ncbi:MAG: hypothetical protein IPM16_07895 [Chloroflexi bacterium]|nr:hypothetical protein [Chloroflexota bacterium]
MKHMRSIFALMMVILVAAACQQGGSSGGGGGGGSTSGSPTDVAKTFFEAAFAGDADGARAALCEAQAGEAEAIAQAFGGLAAAVPGVEVTFDFSELTYTASDVTDTTATVAVGGEISVTAAGVEQAVPVDGIPPLQVVVENGAWKLCPTNEG